MALHDITLHCIALHYITHAYINDCKPQGIPVLICERPSEYVSCYWILLSMNAVKDM